jgi:hypothetical protein
MLYFELPLTVLILLIVAYQVYTIYWKRSLTEWIVQLSIKYGFDITRRNFFYKRLLAWDKKRGVLVYLDISNGQEIGHVIGIHEILSCELLVHENNDSNRHTTNIDNIVLELTLRTNDKIVSLPLYSDTVLARFAKKRLQLTAIRWHETISKLIEINIEVISQTG